MLINAFGAMHLRLLTHFDAPRQSCEKALEVIAEIAQQSACASFGGGS